MKRNLDLARKILLKIEESGEASGHSFIRLRMGSDYPAEAVSYHIQLLDEAGLIEAYDASTLNSFNWYPKRLTWYGHEFLDSTRNENVWEETKKRMERIGSSSFDVLLEVAKSVVIAKLGLG